MAIVAGQLAGAVEAGDGKYTFQAIGSPLCETVPGLTGASLDHFPKAGYALLNSMKDLQMPETRPLESDLKSSETDQALPIWETPRIVKLSLDQALSSIGSAGDGSLGSTI